MATRTISARRSARQPASLTDRLSAQLDKVGHFVPGSAKEFFEEARKQIEATGRAAEKRAARLSRELRAQGGQIWKDLEKFARRRFRVIEGRVEQTRRPLQRQAERVSGELRARVEALRERLERQLRHYLTQRLHLASHTEVSRLQERIAGLEKRLHRLELRERATTTAKPPAPSAAA